MHRSRSAFALSSVVACALAVSACASVPGSSGSDARSAESIATGAGTAVSVDNCGRTETFAATPSRVVILNGASVAEVESFIELGLSDTIVANTQNYGVSDVPGLQQKIAALPTGGLTTNESAGVPAEELLAQKADLVVSPYGGGFDSKSGFATRAELEKAGTKTLVNPVGCANGVPDATPAETKLFETAGVSANFRFLTLLGTVFHIEHRAEVLIAQQKKQLTATAHAVRGAKLESGLVISPGTSDSVPTVWTGGIFDDILKRARVTNAFGGESRANAGTISAEQLAAAKVDVLVLFVDSTVDAETFVSKTFAAYPRWAAAKTHRFVIVHDGLYSGPASVAGIKKVARAAHPDAF